MDALLHNDKTSTQAEEKGSMSKFFSDAYEQGVVKTITDHPKEAAMAAVAVGAVAAAAALTRGRSVVQETLVPATEAILSRGIPLTPGARAAVQETMHLRPWERNSAIRGITEQMENSSALRPGMGMGKEGGTHAPSLETSAVTRAVENFDTTLRNPPGKMARAHGFGDQAHKTAYGKNLLDTPRFTPTRQYPDDFYGRSAVELVTSNSTQIEAKVPQSVVGQYLRHQSGK